MLDINNKTQSEIEEMFSDENYNQELALAVNEFIQKLPQSIYDTVGNIVPSMSTDDVDVFMVELITMIGTRSNGLAISEDYPHIREFSAEQMVLSIARMIPNVDKNQTYVIAMDIVAELDTVFWDINQEHKMSEEGNWYTATTVVVDFEVSSDAEKLSGYKRFKLPLIERPIPWVRGSNEGGYHLDTGKVTLNKGEKDQPQNVLDILNKLQDQKFTLRSYNLQEQFNYALNRIASKNWKSEESAHLKSAQVLFTTMQESYLAMEGQQFSFAWKYDFRLRAYSVGYDINIQGASYQKSMIKPVFIEGVHYNKGN